MQKPRQLTERKSIKDKSPTSENSFEQKLFDFIIKLATMSEIAKDSFYKERYYQLSVNSWGEGEEKDRENRRIKELSKNTMTPEIIK